MSEITAFYFIVVLWLAPWIVALIYMMYKFNRLNKKLEKFIEENIEDDN